MRGKMQERKSFFNWNATWVLGICIAISTLIHFFPYLFNYKYLIASAPGDDSLYVYNVISKFPNRFLNDVVYYVSHGHIPGSIINYGSIWVTRVLHVPMALIHNVLVFFQLFALPALFVIALRKHLDRVGLVFTFLLTLTSGFVYWNFANFGEIEIPYAASIALPFVWLGMWMIVHGRLAGYGLIALTGLIHPLFGLHAFVILFLFHAFHFKELHAKHWLLLAVTLVCALAQPLYVMSLDFPHVSHESFIRVLQLNMHATPWDSPFRWYQTVPTTMAAAYLTWAAYPMWKTFGKRYYTLIVCAIAASVILCASHLIGHRLNVPRLVQIMGLRSPTILMTLLMPIFILYLHKAVSHSYFLPRLAAAFLVLLMVIARPHGLDKMPILFLGVFFALEHKKFSFKLPTQTLRVALYLIFGAWCVGWMLYTAKPPDPFAAERIGNTWSILDYPKFNWFADFGPIITRLQRVLVVVGAFVVALWPFLRNSRISALDAAGRCSPFVILTILVFASMSYNAYFNQTFFGNQHKRDLYEAQMWARENTLPTDTFMGISGSWRSFSERALYPLLPQRAYYYHPDKRAKEFDDQIISILSLVEGFKNYNQKEWYFATWMSFHLKIKRAVQFIRLAKITKARYLIETRKIKNLPVVFSNEHFNIYDLGFVHRLGEVTS